MTCRAPYKTHLVARFGLAPLLSLALLGGCGVAGLSTRQRADTIRFGKSLSQYGQLLTAETTFIRSQVKEMRVMAVSLPSLASLQSFNQGNYARLSDGLDEERCEHIVQIGARMQDFGDALARVADLSTSSVDEQLFQSTARNFVLSVLHATQAAGGVSLGG